jgi:hypothetical protein
MEQRRHRFVSAATHLLIALGVPPLALAVASAAAAMHPVPAPAARAIRSASRSSPRAMSATMPVCAANPSGTDSLDGVLDLEDLNDDGTAHYSGRVIRITEVVACGASRRPPRIRWPCVPPPCPARRDGRYRGGLRGQPGVWVKSEPVSTILQADPGLPRAGRLPQSVSRRRVDERPRHRGCPVGNAPPRDMDDR